MALPSVDGEEIEMYTLISGLRRVYGASRNGYKTIPAFVWHFADYEKAQRLVPLLGLILNKQQQHNYQEIWNGLSTLEHEYGLKFSQIERLYPYLESGDILKLKEVCSESDTYPEPMTELFAGKYLRKKTIRVSSLRLSLVKKRLFLMKKVVQALRVVQKRVKTQVTTN